MEKNEKKQIKAHTKAEKKLAKSRLKQLEKNPKNPDPPPPVTAAQPSDTPSPALRFAEAVRGIIYLVFSVSLIFAVILREQGVLVSLDKIIESLLLIRIGQVVLIVIALALFIYGLKHLRLVK